MKISCSFFRIILCISACIYLFTDRALTADSSVVLIIMHNILDSYYPLIFMLCGVIFLEMYNGSIASFYLKGFFTIVLPLLAASFISLVVQIGCSVSFGFVKDYIRGIVLCSIEPDYLFLYSVIVLYVLAPFFSNMMHILSQKEKRCFFVLIVGYFAFFDFFVLTDMKLAIIGYPFLNITGYAMLGYLTNHIEWKEKEIKALIFSGIISCVISCIEAVFVPDWNWSLDLYCLTRAGMCTAICYILSGVKISNDKSEKIILGFGKSAYYILLLFPIILRFI